jgi:hypothetical protein
MSKHLEKSRRPRGKPEAAPLYPSRPHCNGEGAEKGTIFNVIKVDAIRSISILHSGLSDLNE